MGDNSNNITLSDNVVLASFNAVGSGLGGELDTPNPPGPVSDGSFNTADHLVRVNTGTLNGSYSVLGSSSSFNLDLAADPLDFTATETASIGVSLVNTNGLQRTFEVVTSLPVVDTQVIEGDVDITVNVDGSVTASDTFTVTFPLEGDYNGDGRVNAADYTVWRNSLGATGAGHPADGNFDWVVDESDYTLWKDHFGEQNPRRLQSAEVPEPATAMLGLLAVISLAIRATQRRLQTAL
ncbi:dockerin type I domain-containing protein [Aeoliella sp.]|uniref:dockerin type I domain-containing protein n=1 Tax=Aeoliella sp. TaxID=2795800 RepID=UPI003CCBA523